MYTFFLSVITLYRYPNRNYVLQQENGRTSCMVIAKMVKRWGLMKAKRVIYIYIYIRAIRTVIE